MQNSNFYSIIVHSRIRNLIAFSVLIMLIFCVVVVSQIMQGRKDALENSRQQTESLTNSLADHAEITFISADISLRRAIERQYFNALFGNNLKEHMSKQFNEWLGETPQISALVLTDEQGNINVVASKPKLNGWLKEGEPLNAGDIFSVMESASDEDLFVAQYEMKGEQYIILARRYTKVSGEFGGFVAAIISPGYFSNFYSTIAFGDKQFMAIELITNGKQQVLLDSGPKDSRSNYQDLLDAVSEVSEQDVKTTSVGLKVLKRKGNINLVGSRKISPFNIIVHVMLSEQDIFEDWNRARAKDLGFLVLFIIFGSILSFFAIAMAKQMIRAEESENTAILASQAKSEFLANMSHELRTPLNAIIGYSEMMNSEYFGALNQKQKDRIHDINLCGTHLLQLINDILEFSKGEAGRLELTEEQVDMTEIISEAIRISNAKARSKGVQLAKSIEANLPQVMIDRRKMMQVILNLLTNAIKFTPEQGNVQVSIYTDEHHAVHLLVSDTGIGMRDEDIPRALSVFGQVHRNQDQEGTGLGLPLCKMYTELHGGKFTLSSRLGEGTKVHIILPHQRSMLG